MTKPEHYKRSRCRSIRRFVPTTRPPKTIVKPTALGPVANTDTKLLIYGLFQKGRVLAQDGGVGPSITGYSGAGTSARSAKRVGGARITHSRTKNALGQAHGIRMVMSIFFEPMVEKRTKLPSQSISQ